MSDSHGGRGVSTSSTCTVASAQGAPSAAATGAAVEEPPSKSGEPVAGMDPVKAPATRAMVRSARTLFGAPDSLGADGDAVHVDVEPVRMLEDVVVCLPHAERQFPVLERPSFHRHLGDLAPVDVEVQLVGAAKLDLVAGP